MLHRTDITAAREVESNRLEAVEDETTRERYATEASRMATQHEPGEPVSSTSQPVPATGPSQPTVQSADSHVKAS